MRRLTEITFARKRLRLNHTEVWVAGAGPETFVWLHGRAIRRHDLAFRIGRAKTAMRAAIIPDGFAPDAPDARPRPDGGLHPPRRRIEIGRPRCPSAAVRAAAIRSDRQAHRLVTTAHGAIAVPLASGLFARDGLRPLDGAVSVLRTLVVVIATGAVRRPRDAAGRRRASPRRAAPGGAPSSP